VVQTISSAEALSGRIFNATLEAFDLFAVYLGDRLGYYRALADTETNGAVTSAELGERTGTNERYAREWLEQQAITDILICENPAAEPAERRYRMPSDYTAVFTDPDNSLTMTPMAQIFVGAVTPMPQILAAYRTGGGVPYEDYGPDLAEGQGGTTRPMFRHQLAQEWIAAMPDVTARLQADPPARVADIGMGVGWSSIALAQAFPKITVDGYDLDAASVASATDNAAAEGMQDRVRFHHRDAGDADLAGSYDFALAVECIHDMPNPVPVLAAMRRLVGPGGTVLIVDEKAADRFAPPGDEVERYFYGFSLFHCLPVGMTEPDSVATGTVIREPTMRDFAEQAGFSSVEVLPVASDVFRMYRMTA
jgi:2-polyprenyl-3-methyl-5-hydroxy-6-metoxy-1,4-benzoquinol methylase